MSREAFNSTLPPEVAHHLDELPEEDRQRLGEVILGLTHGELHHRVDNTDAIDFEQPVARAEIGPEHQVHIDGVTKLMSAVSEAISEAHQNLSEQSEGLQDDAQSLLSKAMELTIDKAVESKSEEDNDTTIEHLKTYSIINTIRSVEPRGWRYGAPEREPAQIIVRAGLAKELVTAIDESQGTVYIHHQLSIDGDDKIEALPLYEGFKRDTDVIKLASGIDFDENFDYPTPLNNDDSEKASQQRQEMLETLSGGDLIALGVDAQKNSQDSSLAMLYIGVASNRYFEQSENPRADDIVDLVSVAHEANNSDSQYKAECQAIIREVSINRAPNSEYRGNSPRTGAIDQAIVRLLNNGQEELARQFISGAHEDQKLERWQWIVQYVAPDKESELSEKIVEISQEKARILRSQLEQRGLSNNDIDEILHGLGTPETILEASGEFWEIIHEVFDPDEVFDPYDDGQRNYGDSLMSSGELNGTRYELTNFLGNGAPGDLALMSKLVVIAHQNDLDLDTFIGYEVIGLGSEEKVMEEVERRINLKSSIETFLETINGTTEAGYRSVTFKDVADFAQQFEDSTLALNTFAELYSHQIREGDRFGRSGGREALFGRLSYHFKEVLKPDSGIYSLDGQKKLLEIDEHDLHKLRYVRDEFGELTRIEASILRRFIQTEDYRQSLDLIKQVLSDDIYNDPYSTLSKQLFNVASVPGFEDKIRALLDERIIYAIGDEGSLFSSKRAVISTILRGNHEIVLDLLADEELLTLIGSESDYAEISADIINWILTEKFDKKTIINVLNNPNFPRIVSPQSPAYFMANAILLEVLSSDDPGQVVETYASIINDSASLWKISANLTLYKYGQSRFSGRPTSNLSKLPSSLPAFAQGEYSPDSIIYVSGEDAAEYLRLAGATEEVISTYIETGEVNLSALPEEIIEAVLISNVYETITMSRNQQLRLEASERNTTTSTADILKPGNLSHRASIGVVSKIIQNGCLPGEFLLDVGTLDATPLASDFIRISSSGTASFEETLNNLGNSGYGDVNFIFRRGEEAHRNGEEYSAGIITSEHYVVSGGLPSTELLGIVIPVASDSVDTIKIILIQNDIYIPLFDETGKKLFTYDEYKERRISGNYEKVRPLNIDGAIRQPDSQKGSNEGAIFVLPETNGLEAGRYYVKFSTDSDQQHLWNELLSDSIYRAVAPELVPDTVPVFIEGRMGRASKVAEADDTPVSNGARNAGFVLDALLGNWDAVYNTNNLFMSEGVAMRIDTGNSLFYRARGQQKTDENFGPIVTELELGTDTGSLGKGMRQMYPELTQEFVGEQVEALSEELTDEKIDELVNNVRMPKEYRDKVATVLKQRRDYIIRWVSSEPLVLAA